MNRSSFLGRLVALFCLLAACDGRIGSGDEPVLPGEAPVARDRGDFVPNAAAISFVDLTPVRPMDAQLAVPERTLDKLTTNPIAIADLFLEPKNHEYVDPGTPIEEPDAGTPIACPGSQTFCSAQCVDLQTDELNCGGCGNECGYAESCNAGSCGAGCCQ